MKLKTLISALLLSIDIQARDQFLCKEYGYPLMRLFQPEDEAD